MSFKIRISLITPIGTTIKDKTFEFTREVEARDKTDMAMMICDKRYFETLAEYESTVDAVSKVLQGYEYSIRPIGRKIQTRIDWFRKGSKTGESELK